MHNIFFPKRAIFLVKGAQFLTPQTIFIAFSYMNFLEMPNLKKKSKIFYFFWVFFYIFPFKGLFYHFTKAHKNFSRSHLTLKVAPMCSKAHTINHSGCQGLVGTRSYFGKLLSFTKFVVMYNVKTILYFKNIYRQYWIDINPNYFSLQPNNDRKWNYKLCKVMLKVKDLIVI